MRRLNKSLAIALFAIVGMAVLQLRASVADSTQSNHLWSVTGSPYIDTEYDSRPVAVKSVITDFTKEITVNKVGISNRSRAVASVKLRWYLTDSRTPGTILQTGETAEIKIPGGIAPGETREVSYDVVSFLSLIGGSKENIRGEFRIDVAVSAASYMDGSSWTGKPVERLSYKGTSPKVVRASYSAMQSCSPTYTVCRMVYLGAGQSICDCGQSNPSPTRCTMEGGHCMVEYCG